MFHLVSYDLTNVLRFCSGWRSLPSFIRKILCKSLEPPGAVPRRDFQTITSRYRVGILHCGREHPSLVERGSLEDCAPPVLRGCWCQKPLQTVTILVAELCLSLIGKKASFELLRAQLLNRLLSLIMKLKLVGKAMTILAVFCPSSSF